MGHVMQIVRFTYLRTIMLQCESVKVKERQQAVIHTIKFHTPPSKPKGKEAHIQLINVKKDPHSKPNEQLFPKQMVIQLA